MPEQPCSAGAAEVNVCSRRKRETSAVLKVLGQRGGPGTSGEGERARAVAAGVAVAEAGFEGEVCGGDVAREGVFATEAVGGDGCGGCHGG